MRFNIPAWLGLLLLTGLPVAPAAGEPLTLAELQDQAVARRHSIRSHQDQVAIEEKNIQIGRSAWYPRLDAAYRLQQLDEATRLETRAGSRLEAALSYNVFAGGRDYYTLRAAELTAQATARQLDAARADLRLEVALRYLDGFESYRRWQITIDEEGLLQKRYEDANNRFQVGLIRRNDLLKIQVELDYLAQNKRRAQADYYNRLAWLANAVAGELAPGDLSFADLADLPQLQEDADYQARMLANHSTVQALELTGQALAQQEKVAAAAAWPQVHMALIHAHYGDNFGLGAGSLREDDTRLQLSLSLNLFDGYRTRHTRQRARLAAGLVQHDLVEFKNHLITTLHQILLEYRVALANLTVAEAGIVQARENLRVTDAAYREGLETAADVLDAVFLLSRAEYSYASARTGVFREYFRLVRVLEEAE